MDIETSNAIKLFFPNPSLVQVFFEALANSLDAGATKVSICNEIQAFTEVDTLKITVTDNGGGFTNERFDRFSRLLNPQDSFHKGLGRLVYLNYFERIPVDSIWGTSRRTFTFWKGFKGESQVESLTTEHPDSTTLVFTNFIGERVKSYDYLKPGSLKEQIIEQFLPTLYERFRTKKEFTITISLQTAESNVQKDFFSTEDTITTADLPDLTSLTITDPTLDTYEGIEMLY